MIMNKMTVGAASAHSSHINCWSQPTRDRFPDWCYFPAKKR